MTHKSYLHRLIDEGEHQRQDFKYKVADAVKLARSVSAFANTEGGRLLIGVRDDGHISGVRSEEEIYMMSVAGGDYCRPATAISFETLSVEGRTVVIATVETSTQKPVRALGEDGKWRAYVRIADENIVASPVHLRLWHDETATRGQLFSMGEAEHHVIAALETGTPLTLSQLVRKAGVGRYKTIAILSRLIRFGLAKCLYEDGRFFFQRDFLTPIGH